MSAGLMGLLYAKVVLLESKVLVVEKAVLLISTTLWGMSSIV
jgi:hypothetical protein